MKRGWILILVMAACQACNNDATVKISVDSVGKKFDSKAEKIWDSTKQDLKEGAEKLGEKAEELKEKTKDKLKKTDSIHIYIHKK